MKNIKILDCTLRDGGYVNDWRFGAKGISRIIENLEESNIEIIECGFIRNEEYSKGRSVYSSMKQLEQDIVPKKAGILYAVMIEYHNHVEKLITPYDGKGADIIRLTFRKNEWEQAKLVADKIKKMGYLVCIQPVGTTTYEDAELLNMVQEINQLKPYAFYLVDTLGMMYTKDIRRLYYLVDNNLSGDISIGLHSHNNLQMSFANAQEMIKLAACRPVIIDTSCYGMGRGVGNLPTELFADFINNELGTRYPLTPILELIDQYLMPIYAKHRWGYDLPYFLSGTLKCHPNYATFLMSKDALGVKSIERIISSLDTHERCEFNEELIQKMYLKYQESEIDDTCSIKKLEDKLAGKDVMILGSGASIKEDLNLIKRIKESKKLFTISVNFLPREISVDAMFISNEKRLGLLEESKFQEDNMLITSNLNYDGNTSLIFNYSQLLGEGDELDNSGAMLIRLLKKIKARKVFLAGFDGYSIDLINNYSESEFIKSFDYDLILKKNTDISKQLKNALNGVEYEFITKTRYKI